MYAVPTYVLRAVTLKPRTVMYASIDLINLRPSKQILQPTENWKYFQAHANRTKTRTRAQNRLMV